MTALLSTKQKKSKFLVYVLVHVKSPHLSATLPMNAIGKKKNQVLILSAI